MLVKSFVLRKKMTKSDIFGGLFLSFRVLNGVCSRVILFFEIILSSHTYIHVRSEDQGCTKGEEPILVVPYIELNKNIQVV